MYLEYLGGKRDLKKRFKFSLSVTMKKVRNKTRIKFIKNHKTFHATDAHAHTAPQTASSDHFAKP